MIGMPEYLSGCPVNRKKFFCCVRRKPGENIIVGVSGLRLHQPFRFEADLYKALQPFSGDSDILHVFPFRRVRARLLNQPVLLSAAVEKNEKGACLVVISHIHPDVFGNRAGHNHTVFVNVVEFVYIEQLRKVLHF